MRAQSRFFCEKTLFRTKLLSTQVQDLILIMLLTTACVSNVRQVICSRVCDMQCPWFNDTGIVNDSSGKVCTQVTVQFSLPTLSGWCE